jgi:hypothetical protein
MRIMAGTIFIADQDQNDRSDGVEQQDQRPNWRFSLRRGGDAYRPSGMK